MQPAKPLKTLQANPDLIEVSETITYNFGLYHEQSIQLEQLQSWVTKTREDSLNVIRTNNTNK